MGGNALAKYGARRYDKVEYRKLADFVMHELTLIVPNHTLWEIPSYTNKTSFGDLDLLVYTLDAEHYLAIRSNFGNQPYVRNGDVMSILIEQLQVDIIPMPSRYMATARRYYSYNDLGNLMGKIFHVFGLKYGHKGLTLPVRVGTNMVEEIEICKTGRETFAFIGLDYANFVSGFDDLEDIYKYVYSSPYFSNDIFQYENLNHANRVRDKKRTTYHGFLEYIKVRPSRKYAFLEDRSLYLRRIFDHFPRAEVRYNSAIERLKEAQGIKEIFSGKVISSVTGLSGIELGKFMTFIKTKHPDYKDWVQVYHNGGHLEGVIQNLFTTYKGQPYVASNATQNLG